MQTIIDELAKRGDDELATLLDPFIRAWAEIGDMCNTDAMDDPDEDEANDFMRGRSSASKSVLRIMAKYEGEAASA